MIKTPPRLGLRRLATSRPKAGFVRLAQLAITLLVAAYMLLVGGTFDAGLRFRVQLLNTLLAGLLGLAWWGWRVARRQPLPASGLEWALGLFALSQWLALATSAQPRLSLEWAAAVTAWCAALLVLYDLLRAGWPRVFVVNALLLLATLITLQGLAEVALWYAGWLGLGQWPPLAFRLNGLLGHANLTAALVNLLLPLVLVCAAQRQPRAGRLALATLASGMLVVVFFTSSRAGWLSAGVGLGALATLAWMRAGRPGLAPAWQRWRALPAAWRWLSALGAVSAAGTAAGLLTAQSQHITHGPLFASRQTFWDVAWQMFRLGPLTGAGPDLYTWFYTRWVPSPPGWFAPHAHSLPLQIMSGSGVLGLAALLGLTAAATWQLGRRWAKTDARPWLSASIAGLATVAFHHLFDYLLSSALMVFAVVVVLALALAIEPASPKPRAVPALALAPALLLPLAVAAYALRGAALNDLGLNLAAARDWPAAARAFEQAASADPGLTLYWQHAAYARTLAGDVAGALPLWQRAATDDPYWPVLQATLGVLTERPQALLAASAMSDERNELFALNEGVLAEEAGHETAAWTSYQRALALRPASAAALFWHQTALRRSALAEWQAGRGTDNAPASLGQRALAAGDAAQARAYFEQALAENAGDLSAYVGLASAYELLGEAALADRYQQAALRLPVVGLDETLAARILAGDLARARGELAAAAQAYGEAFSLVNDYTIFGPGSYGYPRRTWYVYRRPGLPSDLVPQFARADVTPALDERFAWLAEHLAAQGDVETACFIAGRVWREAPESVSGRYWRANCR